MTSILNLKKLISAPLSDSPTMQRKNTRDFVNIYRGARMIPYSFDGPTASHEVGVLCLVRNENDKKLELHFVKDMCDDEPMWKCTLDQFDQLKRPRPNLLCIESYVSFSLVNHVLLKICFILRASPHFSNSLKLRKQKRCTMLLMSYNPSLK